MNNLTHISGIIETLTRAGTEILSVAGSGRLNTNQKEDNSPVTDADRISDSIIRESLLKLTPNIPLRSEEEDSESLLMDTFWLLDPLDGTKEFIKGNGEYCISLALIKGGRPVEAYIHSPASGETWYASKGSGAYKIINSTHHKLPLTGIESRDFFLLLKSRSHHSDAETEWERMAGIESIIKTDHQGSAVKFCRIAEGGADLYIKKGNIFGWDIAAGDLILTESGGGIFSYPSGDNIIYTPDSSPMPHFLAFGCRVDNPKEMLF